MRGASALDDVATTFEIVPTWSKGGARDATAFDEVAHAPREAKGCVGSGEYTHPPPHYPPLSSFASAVEISSLRLRSTRSASLAFAISALSMSASSLPGPGVPSTMSYLQSYASTNTNAFVRK